MNNKLMSYEEAKKKLKELERRQRINKQYRSIGLSEYRELYQKFASDNKKEINFILNIIHLHKQSRKLYYLVNHYMECAENEK